MVDYLSGSGAVEMGKMSRTMLCWPPYYLLSSLESLELHFQMAHLKQIRIPKWNLAIVWLFLRRYYRIIWYQYKLWKKQADSLVVLASRNEGIIKGYVVKNTNMASLNPKQQEESLHNKACFFENSNYLWFFGVPSLSKWRDVTISGHFNVAPLKCFDFTACYKNLGLSRKLI